MGIKYDITSDRLIRMLEIAENGEDTVVYESVNPVARTRATAQLIAFAVYGAFAAVCIALYLKKREKSSGIKKERRRRNAPAAFFHP